MWLTIIEWDGKQPPTQYYTRLTKLGLKVRGDKDEPPISRRKSEEEPAVIAQEGAILTATESLANVVADYARLYGARSVHVGEISFKEHNAEYFDVELMKQIESVLGARGRRPVYDEDFWSVTCFECVRGTETESEVRPVQCPKCSGVRTYVRLGSQSVYGYPPNTDVSDLLGYWYGSRFAEGMFQIPGMSAYASTQPTPNAVVPDQVKEVVESINIDVLEFLFTTQHPDTMMHILDGIVVGALHHTPEHMVSHRVRLANVAAQRGYSTEVFPLIQQDELDLLDSVAIMPKDFKGIADEYHQFITTKGDIK